MIGSTLANFTVDMVGALGIDLDMLRRPRSCVLAFVGSWLTFEF